MANKKPEQKPPLCAHEWDGIKEYNNPLPRWWVWVFWLTVIFSVGYVIYYPAFPSLTSYSKGVGNWSQYSQLNAEIAKGEAAKQVMNDKISTMDVAQINQTLEVQQFAIAGGKALFALHCSQCHGAGANGAKGYPSLLDDEWLWGGKLEDIQTTITHGIRSYDDDDTHDSEMTAFGVDEYLEPQQITDVTSFVQVIAGTALPSPASVKGQAIFAENCAACHGDNGEGIQDMGAPPLNNKIWLYGGDTATITETIHSGRKGHMPAFMARLSENDIKKLAVYVHSLGGGE